MIKRNVQQSPHAGNLHRHFVFASDLLKTVSKQPADALYVGWHIELLHLADGCERGGRSDRFGPVSARNKRLLGSFHD